LFAFFGLVGILTKHDQMASDDDALAQVLAEQAETSRCMEEYASGMVDSGLFGPVLELAVSCNHRSATVLRAARQYLAQTDQLMLQHERDRAAGRVRDLDELTDDVAREARVRLARLLLAEAELQKQVEADAVDERNNEVESHATQLRQALMDEQHKQQGIFI
jgi:hypothetical protein